MFVSECLNINKAGHLTIGDCDTVELAQNFGTPLYVMDEGQIRKNCAGFKNAIKDNYDGNGMVAFASKAFCCKAICRIMVDEQMALDVVSGGELYTALESGFPAQRILFHGNIKTAAELAYAVENGVGRIVVDNIYDLELLNQIALSADKVVNIQLRLTPGVDPHTHSKIITGSQDSKFGFSIKSGDALKAAKTAIEMKNINLIGLHCHIGSQIFDVEPFQQAAKIMLEFIADINKKFGHEIVELNLGGGFGIHYLEENTSEQHDKYMKGVSKTVKETCKELGIAVPFIIIEPGRSIVANAGITLYNVSAVKEIENIRNYIIVDGGFTDNPRYALYQSEYQVLLANKADQIKSKSVTVAGRCCESGDLIGENMPLQNDIKVGDILAVLATGAYNYSMASNYNRLPRPAVVMVKDGKAHLAVKRETYEDIVRNDI